MHPHPQTAKPQPPANQPTIMAKQGYPQTSSANKGANQLGSRRVRRSILRMQRQRRHLNQLIRGSIFPRSNDYRRHSKPQRCRWQRKILHPRKPSSQAATGEASEPPLASHLRHYQVRRVPLKTPPSHQSSLSPLPLMSFCRPISSNSPEPLPQQRRHRRNRVPDRVPKAAQPGKIGSDPVPVRLPRQNSRGPNPVQPPARRHNLPRVIDSERSRGSGRQRRRQPHRRLGQLLRYGPRRSQSRAQQTPGACRPSICAQSAGKN